MGEATTYQIIALIIDATKAILVGVCGLLLCRMIRILIKIEKKL